MSKGGKHAKGPGGAKMRVRKMKQKQVNVSPGMIKDGESMVPNRPATIADLKGMYDQLMKDMGRLIQDSEMKTRITAAKMAEEMSNIKANQIVTQTMLMRAGHLDREEFKAAYEKYIEKTQGVLTLDGGMKGSVAVDIYNIGKSRKPTSAPVEHTGHGPVVVIQQ